MSDENRLEGRATVFAPGSVGNVGPGFDVLGLAIDGVGDRVTVERIDGSTDRVTVRGTDAGSIPTDPRKNAASIAARALVDSCDVRDAIHVTLEKGLPLSGGMGGSAASSVAGAVAAAHALGLDADRASLVRAALVGESAVAGRHLDNIGPSLLGGLVLVLTGDPPELVRLPVADEWWIALATPAVRLETRAGRAVLPNAVDRELFVAQMARTTAMARAFETGDADLMRRALDDHFAEPLRAPLIPHFDEVKHAALEAGACGASISGSGPTVFALATDEVTTNRACNAMTAAFGDIEVKAHVAKVAIEGAGRIG